MTSSKMTILLYPRWKS